jgi:hypothetical protein
MQRSKRQKVGAGLPVAVLTVPYSSGTALPAVAARPQAESTTITKPKTLCYVLCAAVSAATLSEVAGIITSLAKTHLGSLLVHPGHATVGIYYLAKRHEVCLRGWTYSNTSGN